jgi:hypothetical protein
MKFTPNSDEAPHIYGKLGVSTRAAATVFAMHHGLVERSGELQM